MDAVLHSSTKHDWRTPQVVLQAVRRVGRIELDPCTDADNPTKARRYFTEGGLEKSWRGSGLAFVNCPYGREIPKWVTKCCSEAADGREIILLVPSRSDTRWWHEASATAQAACLWRGRLKFEGAPSSAPFPSALFYWGPAPDRFDAVFREYGIIIGRACNCTDR